MNKIPIVMATDSNFVFQTGVAISSMLQNKREETKYAFYILSDGKLLDTEKKMIIEIIESESYSEIDFIDIEMQEVDISSHVCHVSFATYYRFFLSNLLKKCDKCIYVDGDILVLEDLQDVYNTELNGYYLAAVLDCGIQFHCEDYKEYLDSNDIANINQYFNAGFLVMNLKKMREDNLQEKFFQDINKNYKMMDQDILNKWCRNKVKYLPLKYNLFAGFYLNSHFLLNKAYSLKEILEAEKNPAIIHYATSYKPWCNVQFDKRGLWWRQAEKLRLCKQYDELYERAYKGYENSKWCNIIERCSGKENIIVFGATCIGYNVINLLKQGGFNNIYAICDNDENKQGNDYLGVPIRAIGNVLQDVKGNYQIIITSQRYYNEIEKQLYLLNVSDSDICIYKNKDWKYYYTIDFKYYKEEIEEVYLKKYGIIGEYEKEINNWMQKINKKCEAFLELI